MSTDSPKEAPDWLDEVLVNLVESIYEAESEIEGSPTKDDLQAIYTAYSDAESAIAQHIAEQVEAAVTKKGAKDMETLLVAVDAAKVALLEKYIHKVTSVTGFDDPSPMELVYEPSQFAETFREMERELAKLRRKEGR